jgi:hypothetical protein
VERHPSICVRIFLNGGWCCTLVLVAIIIVIVKTILALAAFLVLAGCAKQPIHASGVYRLITEEKSMVLEVRSNGDYVLQINGPERNPDQIRGRWEEARGTGPDVSFHGIVWHGTEPEAGQGIWAARVDGNADICLDAEGLTCFSKDEAS